VPGRFGPRLRTAARSPEGAESPRRTDRRTDQGRRADPGQVAEGRLRASPGGADKRAFSPRRRADPRPKKKPTKTWAFIGIVPQKLASILAEGNFDVEGTIRTWKDRNWLKVTEEGGGLRSRLKVKIGKRTGWVVAITHDAVLASEGG